jgi:hypothetical protein
MPHAIQRVEQFSIVGPYTLALRFGDGTAQRIDCRPVLEGTLFGPLQDVAVFRPWHLLDRCRLLESTCVRLRTRPMTRGRFRRAILRRFRFGVFFMAGAKSTSADFATPRGCTHGRSD